MNTGTLRAVLTEEDDALFRDGSLEPMRRLLRAQPERFRLKAAPEAFPPRKKKDRRRKEPDALRAAPRGRVFPSRLPWDLLPAPRPERIRTRIVCQTLPARELAGLTRTRMKERRITMEGMADILHVSPGTFRRWLRDPEAMTVRDYGALAAWVSGQGAGKNGERRPLP